MTEPAPLHPRPQLTRPRWTDLCGEWGFAVDDGDVGVDERWQDRADVFDARIVVPFPPESPASGIGDVRPHSVVWYRRTFHPVQEAGERLLLHFGAVDYRADVWVNGRLVASHEGGHTPFSADVTAALTGTQEQVLVVRAEDPLDDLSQPRGKQDWLPEPHRIWYDRTTGIWQPVWLEPVGATRVAAVRWTPDLRRGVLAVRVEVNRVQQPGLRLRVHLTLHGEVIADDTYAVSGNVLSRDIVLDSARQQQDRRRYLWAPEHPNLVSARVTLLDGDEVLDEVGSYAGLRSVGAASGHFELNGRPYYLRLVLAQNYWPESHLAAPSPDALRREVELAKSLGFNGVRIHQKIEDPRFLYWCDTLGLVAWGELPSALDFTTTALTRLTREWLEMLERDASSPALVAWVPYNESWGVPHLRDERAQQQAVRALYALTKAIDPTRLVIGNDGWEHLVSDVFTVHDYSAAAETLRERYGTAEALDRTLRTVQPYYRSIVLPSAALGDEPVMLTEFGGVTYDAESEDFWNGYGSVTSPADLVTSYAALVAAVLESSVVAGFCWTQLTDTRQERNGLLTAAREPKADVAALAAATRGAAASIPADGIAQIQLDHQRRRDSA